MFDVAIAIRSVFDDNNKYYSQVISTECLDKLGEQIPSKFILIININAIL